MISSVKIGFVNIDHNSQVVSWLEDRFRGFDPNQTVIDQITMVETNPNDIWSGLGSGELGAVAIPLDKAPFELPETIQYFCLTKLPERRRKILCIPEVYQEDNDGKLADKTRVMVDNDVLGSQLLQLNHTLKIITRDTEKFNLPPKREVDKPEAVLLFDDPGNLDTSLEGGLKIINLHPNEFLEVAGYGKLVWAAHKESRQLMTALRYLFHQPEIVACSNTERKIQQNMASLEDWTIRVRCYQDQRNFYHVRAMMIHNSLGTVVSHTMSQSTHHLLAEKMTSVLMDLIKK